MMLSDKGMIRCENMISYVWRIMKESNKNYISQYNKRNYVSFLLRVPKKEMDIIQKMNSLPSKNHYLLELLDKDVHSAVLKLKDIKKILKEYLAKYDIHEIYLFGSYARGEAKERSDVDILCERGEVRTLIQKEKLVEEIESRLGKPVDLLFLDAKMPIAFKEEIEKDLIRLC